MIHKTLFLLAFVAIGISSFAAPVEGVVETSSSSFKRLKANCQPASASADLDINNVRARILNGGDMWWDLVGTARYEVPKVPEGSDEPSRTSLFAGSVWIGGLYNGNILTAAMTYRQNGSDFYPGALDTTNASIDEDDCNYWDRIFEVTREEIDDHIASFEEGNAEVNSTNIATWPGNGRSDAHEHYFMAPYVNVAGSPDYEPELGDYPDVNGDQTLWYVYNDVGNLKRQTNSPDIGIEMRTMAFGFATSDEINNMTFYETTIYNTGDKSLDSTFFGQWVDADLGYAYDDYVGCDVERGLGICYNGDNFDEGAFGYGSNPPSVGVDFFQGPTADLEVLFNNQEGDGIDNDNDGLVDEEDTTHFAWYRARGLDFPTTYEGDGRDNNRNGVIDEPDEDIIMSKFVYYNNDFNQNGNPRAIPEDHYNYLRGRWKNNDCIKFGGNGFSDFDGGCTDFMFPDDPRDPDGWSEVTSNNQPADRRFLQTAGPFTLKAGAVNKVTVGVVWARASSGGNTGSYDQLLLADDKAQQLFNNDFELLDGPDAPDLRAVALDREIILIMNREQYLETEQYEDQQVSVDGEVVTYSFQGYQLYQLANDQVANDQLTNPDLAREVWQSDLDDGIGLLVNQEFDPVVSSKIAKIKVDGADVGPAHTVRINTDVFASGNTEMVNHKTYHFLLLAYASADEESADEDIQYLQGRRAVRVSVTPRQTESLNSGTQVNTTYGDGPKITRLEGDGNGGISLDLDEASEEEILENGFVQHPTYDNGHGPVNIKVIDPLGLANNQYTLRFMDPKVAGTDGEPLTITTQNYEDDLRVQRGELDVAESALEDATVKLNELQELQDSIDLIDSLTNQFWPSEIQDVNDTIDAIRDSMIEDDSLNVLRSRNQVLIAILDTITDPVERQVYQDEQDTLLPIIQTQNGYRRAIADIWQPRLDELNENINVYNAARILAQKWIDENATKIQDEYDDALTEYNDNLDGFNNSRDSLNARINEAEKVIWELVRVTGESEVAEQSDTLRAERPLYIDNEMVIDAWGFSIEVGPVFGPGESSEDPNNGFLEGTIEYEDDAVQWLAALPDRDGVGTENAPDPLDWIRAGGNIDRPDPASPIYHDVAEGVELLDDDAVYENVIDGLIAPFVLASRSVSINGLSSYGISPSTGYNQLELQNFSILPSVDLVFTDDRSKWTKVAVVEMGEDPAKSAGNVNKFRITSRPSLQLEPDGEGNPVYSSSETGYSWFPGYAINVETGERLNIIMGENTTLAEPNAKDMIWNPTPELVSNKGIPFNVDGGLVVGGMHYIYIMGTTSLFTQGLSQGQELEAYRYNPDNVSIDDYKPYQASLNNDESTTSLKARRAWNSCMWVMPAYLAAGQKLKSFEDGLIPTQARIRVRVNTPYQTREVNDPPLNANMPMFEFGTEDIAPTFADSVGTNALEEVRIVPNPYYAFSTYERTQIENAVKITNLPTTCTVRIYTVSGQLVRKIERDQTSAQNESNEYKWDMKNDVGVPIASGIYIFHVDAGELGETTVKFFAGLRPVDLDTF